MARRKSAGERRQEKVGKPNQYWEKFRSILQAVQDCGEALALALAIPASVAERDDIITISLVVVAFSIFVQGLTMAPIVRRLGLIREPEK